MDERAGCFKWIAARRPRIGLVFLVLTAGAGAVKTTAWASLPPSPAFRATLGEAKGGGAMLRVRGGSGSGAGTPTTSPSSLYARGATLSPTSTPYAAHTASMVSTPTPRAATISPTSLTPTRTPVEDERTATPAPGNSSTHSGAAATATSGVVHSTAVAAPVCRQTPRLVVAGTPGGLLPAGAIISVTAIAPARTPVFVTITLTPMNAGTPGAAASPVLYDTVTIITVGANGTTTQGVRIAYASPTRRQALLTLRARTSSGCPAGLSTVPVTLVPARVFVAPPPRPRR